MGLSPLANYIYLTREHRAPILLLGAGCSVSSGCPSAKKLIDELIKDNGLNIENNSLEEIEKQLNRSIFNLNLQPYFSNSNPSKGYWFLAELIKKRYFDIILTTNYDTCLEKVLSKVIEYDAFRVCVRGDIPDDRINEIINLPTPRIKIIKLHGDYQSKNMLVKAGELWNLKEELRHTLHSKIKENGIIVIGYSMHDISALRTFPNDDQKNFWYLNKENPDATTKTVLSGLSINADHIFTGDKWAFDEFFSSLSRELGEKDKKKEKRLNNDFNKVKDEVMAYTKYEIDPVRLKFYIQQLAHQIRNNRIQNIVFIHDPGAPGGSEVLKIIKKNYDVLMMDKNIFKLTVSGRGPLLHNRFVEAFQDEDNNNVPANLIQLDQGFLLVDSISFTGNTLEICKKYLLDTFGNNTLVNAAVIFSGRELEKNLKSQDYHFGDTLIKVDQIDFYQVLFPWGWTFATRPIKATESSLSSQTEIINAYIPSNSFSFYPRPWGDFISLMENKQVTVKILYLNPREKTSKHKHFVRTEIFVVLDEHMILEVWDENIYLRRGCSFRVSAGIEHRLIGLDVPCRILEISEGYHNQVEDIKRYDDKEEYGDRVNKKGDV